MNILDTWILKRANKIRNTQIEQGYDFICYCEDLLPGLRAFCVKKLNDKKFVQYNQSRAEIFRETVKLIDDNNSMLWEYIGQNIEWYWD